MTRMRSNLVRAALLFCATSVSTNADTVHVDGNRPNGGDGASWATAFNKLQDGLATAIPGDEVWVAAGVYVPGTGSNIQATFQLRTGVAVYGGFAGTETNRNQRNFSLNVTTLSGDINRDDVYGNPWWNGWNIHTANSIHVVNGSNVGSSARLDGFTIIGGYASQASGGGINIVTGSPAIANCIITRNLSSWGQGSGVSVHEGNPTFDHCTFTQNWGHLTMGAGLGIGGVSNVLVTDCVFTENRCTGDVPEGAGAAINNYLDSTLEVRRSTFSDNMATAFFPSGGHAGTYGGAIHHLGLNLTVTDCTFTRNFANAGGAIWAWRPATIANCIFRDNDAPEYHAQQGGWGGIGGGLGASNFTATQIDIINCTFYGNSAEKGAGIRILSDLVDSRVANCILWANMDRDGSVGTSQIKGTGARYSCIQNMLIGGQGEDPPDPEKFPHCVDIDPLFVDRTNGDFHLGSASPATDAGDNLFVPQGLLTDLDGLPRFADDPLVADTGRGTPPIVDMGPLERQGPPPENVRVTAFSVNSGTLAGGGVAALRTSNNRFVKVQSAFTGDVPPYLMILDVTLRATGSGYSLLDLKVEGKINQNGGTALIYLRDWTTGQWSLIRTTPIGRTETIERMNDLDAARFLSPAGVIRVRVRHEKAISGGAPFISWIDHVHVQLH